MFSSLIFTALLQLDIVRPYLSAAFILSFPHRSGCCFVSTYWTLTNGFRLKANLQRRQTREKNFGLLGSWCVFVLVCVCMYVCVFDNTTAGSKAISESSK